MLPHKHALLSTAVGALSWLQTGEPASLAVAIAAGVLPDTDHVIDYVYFHRYGEHRLILPLHGYEYALIMGGMALITGNALLVVATMSYFVHLIADQGENRTRLMGYSLLFRIRHRFLIEEISREPNAAIQGRVDDMLRIRKWLLR